MAKGIRQFVEQRFKKLLPKLQSLGGQGFRRIILDDTVAQFDISMASASAAYNYVINKVREEDPESVAGLGRTEFGLNAIEAALAAPAVRPRGRQVQAQPQQRRPVGRPPMKRNDEQEQAPGMVTLVKANTGEVMVPSIPRKLAQDLIASSGSGRGKPKLVIQQDQA